MSDTEAVTPVFHFQEDPLTGEVFYEKVAQFYVAGLSVVFWFGPDGLMVVVDEKLKDDPQHFRFVRRDLLPWQQI